MKYNGVNYRLPSNKFDDDNEQPNIKQGPKQWINTKKHWTVGVEQCMQMENDFQYFSDNVLLQAKDHGIKIYGRSSYRNNVNERLILDDSIPDIHYRRPLNRQPIQNVRPDKEIGTIPQAEFQYDFFNKTVDKNLMNKIKSAENLQIRVKKPDSEIKSGNIGILEIIESIPMYDEIKYMDVL